MSNQLQKGDTFVDGQTVNAARLNNLVDLAIVLEAIISGQGSPVTPLVTDQLLLWRSGTPNTLHRGAISGLPAGVTLISLLIDSGSSVLQFTIDNSVPATPVIHIGLDDQIANRVMVGPVSGANATPTFRVLTPPDFTPLTVAIPAADVNCKIGNVFTKTLTATGNTNISISDLADGQTVKVRILNTAAGTSTVSFSFAGVTPVIFWRGGTFPGLTQAPSARDIFTFTRAGVVTYAHADQNYG